MRASAHLCFLGASVQQESGRSGVCVCVLDRRYSVLNCAPSATAINSATGSRPCFCPLLLWRRIAVRG